MVDLRRSILGFVVRNNYKKLRISKNKQRNMNGTIAMFYLKFKSNKVFCSINTILTTDFVDFFVKVKNLVTSSKKVYH